MTWIKICGITNLEDALTAVEAGADALGFVFYVKRRRRVDAESVNQITRHLPRGQEKMGVFVGPDSWERVENAVAEAGLTGMQVRLGDANVSGCLDVTSENTKLYLTLPASLLLSQKLE